MDDLLSKGSEMGKSSFFIYGKTPLVSGTFLTLMSSQQHRARCSRLKVNDEFSLTSFPLLKISKTLDALCVFAMTTKLLLGVCFGTPNCQSSTAAQPQ